MYYYTLQINVPPSKQKKVSSILGLKSELVDFYSDTLYVKVEKEDHEPFLFVDYFLSLLEGKYEDLQKIGVERENISIWKEYAYDSQCNMEFFPEATYRLGKEGITLCVTCWDIHDYDKDYDENGNVINDF